MSGLQRRQATCLGLGSAFGLRAEPLRDLLLPADVLTDLQRFVANRPLAAIARFDGPHARRDVIDVLLLHHAAGLTLDAARWAAMPSLPRMRLELAAGRGLALATTSTADDLLPAERDCWLSEPTVAPGEFEAGLYALAGNARALAVHDAAGLRELSAISSRSWRADWAALQRLPLRALLHAGGWPQMLRMLAAGRADLVLAPFQPGVDMQLQAEGLQLLPLRGLKLQLAVSRHFAVSRRHRQGEAFLARLDAGLRRLRRSGMLRRAYTECGFFLPQVAGWRRL